MTTLIILGIVLVSVAAYLSVGTVLARLATPQVVRVCTHRDPGGYEYICGHPFCNRDANHPPAVNRGQVGLMQVLIVLGWPLALPIHLMSLPLVAATDRADPEIARQQKARIAELERELGIGGKS